MPTLSAPLHNLTWQKRNAEDPFLSTDPPHAADAPVGQDESVLILLSEGETPHQEI